MKFQHLIEQFQATTLDTQTFLTYGSHSPFLHHSRAHVASLELDPIDTRFVYFLSLGNFKSPPITILKHYNLKFANKQNNFPSSKKKKVIFLIKTKYRIYQKNLKTFLF